MIRTTTVGVTGATGKVGRALVPRLRQLGYRTLAFSRAGDTEGAGHDELGYSDLDTKLTQCDVVIHLAALNNDAATQDLAAFRAVNVEFAHHLASVSARSSVRKFINLSTIHALDPGKTDPYSVSKREAVDVLRQVDGLCVANIYASRVFALNDTPSSGIAALFWRVAPTLQPCVSFDQLAGDVVAEVESSAATDRISSHPARTHILYRWAKRAIDMAFVLSVALLFWWLLALVWLAVKLTSAGPGIFAQTRVGKDGAHFTCYKFRTMNADTKSVATHEVAAASVTPLGKFLRASKIDELPQIINLLRNEMTLIGPRPCLPQQKELIRERSDRGVYAITPGISGFSQVNGIDMSDPVRLAQQDAIYLKTQSLIGDIKLLLRTLVGGGSGDKVRT